MDKRSLQRMSSQELNDLLNYKSKSGDSYPKGVLDMVRAEQRRRAIKKSRRGNL